MFWATRQKYTGIWHITILRWDLLLLRPKKCAKIHGCPKLILLCLTSVAKVLKATIQKTFTFVSLILIWRIWYTDLVSSQILRFCTFVGFFPQRRLFCRIFFHSLNAPLMISFLNWIFRMNVHFPFSKALRTRNFLANETEFFLVNNFLCWIHDCEFSIHREYFRKERSVFSNRRYSIAFLFPTSWQNSPEVNSVGYVGFSGCFEGCCLLFSIPDRKQLGALKTPKQSYQYYWRVWKERRKREEEKNTRSCRKTSANWRNRRKKSEVWWSLVMSSVFSQNLDWDFPHQVKKFFLKNF